MTMLSGSTLGPQGDGPRKKRRPWATVIVVLLMMAVVFGGTYGAVVLLRGDAAKPEASAPTTQACVTATVTPGASLPQPSTVTVNVYNATDRAGLAKRTADELKARGFGLGRVANDPLGKSLTNVGEIRYGPTGADNATLLRFYVPKALMVQDERTDATVDLVLGVKYKALAPQKAVDAALAKPVPTVSGSGCPTPTPSPSVSTSRSPKATPSAT
jgi:hypothetical protein